MSLCPGHHSMNPPPTGEITNHGGMPPAALGGVRLPLKLALPSASRSAHHGGMTPAALMNMRLCTANVVFRREISVRTTAGVLSGELTPCIRSGWRKPAVGNHQLQIRYATTLTKTRVRSENIADLYADKRNTPGVTGASHATGRNHHPLPPRFHCLRLPFESQ